MILQIFFMFDIKIDVVHLKKRVKDFEIGLLNIQSEF